MKRLTLTLGLLALATVLAACSGASAAQTSNGPSSAGPSGDAVTVVARDLAFVTPDVTAKAGVAFTIAFDNQDGAPHDISISDASGKNVFKGDIVSAQKIDYHVGALAAGTYSFLCEVHPGMKGTLTVK